MSDIMYNQTEFEGKPYKFGDWQQYAVHDDKNIKGFFGDYRFLSNFYNAETYFDGLLYRSSELAYQAAKVQRNMRHEFLGLTDGQSKRKWKELKEYLLPNWDENKYRIMDIIVYDKFLRNPELRQKLIDTGDRYLEETNHWKDTYWGINYKTGEGQNNLGKILMEVRENLKPIFGIIEGPCSSDFKKS